jgi:hypothetical protein
MSYKSNAHSELHEHLSVEISGFNVRINTGINHEIYDSRYAHDSTRIHKSYISIEAEGLCNYPEDRARARYVIDVTNYGEPDREQTATLKDYQELRSDGTPKCRTRQGEARPIYAPPDGIGYIEKRRGIAEWFCYAPVSGQVISDMLVLLSSTIRPQYFSIHEVKSGRHRRLREITLQTSNPEEE